MFPAIPEPVALGATRTSVANRLSNIANDLALIARQCDQQKLLDDRALDTLDKLATQANKCASLYQEFSQDPEYQVD